MFAADSLGEFDFVLEFNLPKEISDNQEHIKLSVNRVEVPAVEISVVPIGCKSRPIRTPGYIHCMEHYKYIKYALSLINRWVNRIYCNMNSSRSNYFVEAKLYAYKKDNSLFKMWNLIEFYPMFNQDPEYFTEYIELIFKFENVIDEGK